MAVQTMNVAPTADECIFVHLSEIDTKLAATPAWRNRRGGLFVRIVVFWGDSSGSCRSGV